MPLPSDSTRPCKVEFYLVLRLSSKEPRRLATASRVLGMDPAALDLGSLHNYLSVTCSSSPTSDFSPFDFALLHFTGGERQLYHPTASPEWKQLLQSICKLKMNLQLGVAHLSHSHRAPQHWEIPSTCVTNHSSAQHRQWSFFPQIS